MSKPAPSAPAFFKDDAAKARYMAAYDAVLAKWPAPYESLMVPTDLGPTHVIASGSVDAPPLILLHAAMATGVVWRPNVEALGRRFRVYAVDVIGQGGRSVATRKVRDRQDFADWMNALFDGLGIEKASIVGNSYGGWLAFNQASLAPGRVDRIIAISPPGVFVSFAPLARKFMFKAAKAALLGLFGVKRPALGFMKLMGPKARLNPGDEDWVALADMLLDGSVRMNAIMPVVFSDAELAAIRTPALLLIAGDELLYPPEATLRLALEKMPGLQGGIVPDAHHLAAMAQPDDVEGRIIQFLKP
jgi:pimeloyl-ACP methyl ester carboxylesterase